MCSSNPDPAKFLVLKVVFGKLLYQNPSCVPNMKWLDSTVAEITKGPKIFRMLP